MRAHQLLSLSFAVDSKPAPARIKQILETIISGVKANYAQLLAAQRQDISNSSLGAEYQLQSLLAHARALLQRLPHWQPQDATDSPIVKRPAGVVSVFAEECQPLAQALVHCLYAIAAGNKVLLYLSDRCPSINSALTRSLQALDKRDLCCQVYTSAALPDYMRLQSGRLVLSGWRCINSWREELRVSNEVQTERVLQIAPTVNVVLCTPEAHWQQVAEQLLQAQSYQSGQWFACPNQVQIPRSSIVEAVKQLAQASQATPRMYLHNPAWRAELVEQLQDLSAKQVSIVETSLAGDFSPRTADLATLATSAEWPHLLVIDPPSEHPLSRTPLLAPITLLHGYKHISESLAYINSLNKIGVIYSFGADSDVEKLYSPLSAQAIVRNRIPIIYQPGLIQQDHCTPEHSAALYELYRDTTIVQD